MTIARGNTRYWLCQLLAWGLFAAFSVYQNYVQRVPYDSANYTDIAYASIGLAVTHLVRTGFYKKGWNTLPIEKLMLRVLLIVAAQTIVVTNVYLVAIRFISPSFYSFTIKQGVSGLYFISALLLLLWSLLYFIAKFIDRNRMLVIERLQMENSVKTLEIKNIKNNLQPHFIFNALNSIRALVDENPERARQSITQLSNILRSSMMTNKVETVPLHKELEIVKDYLSLEGIRYEERLTAKYNIDPATHALPIPPMMLQTLVENAIKHGIAAQEKGGLIDIASSATASTHTITIKNTGEYNPINVLNTTGGFGLASTKERLRFVFGEQANLSIHNEPNHMVVLTIHIPITTKN